MTIPVYVLPDVDKEAEAFDRGYEAGFLVGLKGSEDAGKEQGFIDARYLVSCAYTELIMDGVTQDNPIVHDVFEYLFKVLDGELLVRDFKNLKEDHDA